MSLKHNTIVYINNFIINKLVNFEGTIRIKIYREFPGSPVVRTWHFHSCGPRFNLWSGNQDPASHPVRPKTKIKKKKE